MFAVTVTLLIKSEKMDEFMPLVLATARMSRTSEQGCKQFDVCTDRTKPATVFLYETYSDAAAFELHLASRHFKDFDAKTTKMIAAKDVQSWEWVIQ